MVKITNLDAPVCKGGESPMWDAEAQCLYNIDNVGAKIHSFEPATGKCHTLEMPCTVTTLVLRKSGGAVVTLRTGIHFLDLEAGALELINPLVEASPYRYNDGKVDSRGRFLIGRSTTKFSAPEPDGGLFSLDPNRKLTQLDADIHYSNGPCWSPDELYFYFSDSWRATTYVCDYDIDTGIPTNRRPFVNTRDLGGLPNGATVDVDGLYWVAVYEGAKIAAYQPDGKLKRVVDMPVKFVSSVAFGGPELDRLFVTTIAQDAPGKPPEGGAGALYVIDGLGTKGYAEYRYAG